MANHSLKGRVLVVGAGAKNLGGLISRTFGAEGTLVAVHFNSNTTKGSAEDTMKAVSAAAMRSRSGAISRRSTGCGGCSPNDEALRPHGHRGQCRREGAEEAVRRDDRGRVRQMFDINRKAAYFFIQEAGKRISDGGRIITIDVAPGRVHGPVLDLCGEQGAGRVLHAIGSERVRSAWHLEQRRYIEIEMGYTEALKQVSTAVVEIERAIGGPVR